MKMTEIEILKQAVAFACGDDSELKGDHLYDLRLLSQGKDGSAVSLPVGHPYALIFNHNFLRHFFTDELVTKYGYTKKQFVGIYEDFRNGEREWSKRMRDNELSKSWAWHAQQMVVEQRPIKYLKKYMDEREKQR